MVRESREVTDKRIEKAALELQWQLSSLGPEKLQDLQGCRCERCHGTGHETCPVCKGTGIIVSAEFGRKFCSHCRGNGKYTCSVCHGTGSIATWMPQG
uniref:CR-type domain-containing protein n=1 Tax=Pinguiococcus pyrenoidosus TaxID=172671 RepID=A0A7R9UFK8_9STRA